MKNKIVFILFVLTGTLMAQQWKDFYNKIPAWPGDITSASVEKFNSALQKLKLEINAGQPDYMAQFSNMDTDESAKLADDMEKNAQKILAAALAGNSSLKEVTTEEVLAEEKELYSELDKIKYDFDNRLFDEVMSLREKYSFNPDEGDTECEPLAKDLVKLAGRYSKDYFTGNNARCRIVADNVIDYIIKVKLPAEVQKDIDKHKMMEIKVSGDQAALQMVQRCLDLLLEMGDRMNYLIRLKGEGNVLYEPGQSW